jgi:hypothetical protein
MGLSEEDRKRIEEEELRRALREKYERELRISADVRADTRSQVDVRGVSAHFVQADTSHQVEVRGVSTEIYRDAKQGLATAAKTTKAAMSGLVEFVLIVICIGLGIGIICALLMFVLQEK